MKTDLRHNYLAKLLLLVCSTCQFTGIIVSQSINQHTRSQNHTQTTPYGLPSFEVISIKLIEPGRDASGWGFRSLPGGRIDIGAIGIRQLMAQAFSVPASQIQGGPEWLNTEGYTIVAVPPDSSSSRTTSQVHESYTPTVEQRLMLQSMLANRFLLRYHEETRRGSAYMLTRGSGTLRLDRPSDPSRQPAFVLFMRGNDYDGEARGANVSMQLVAEQLSGELNAPVVDKTGLAGSYDFYVQAFAPENDYVDFAAIGAMHRLGLDLKKNSAPVRVIVIDSIQRPTPN